MRNTTLTKKFVVATLLGSALFLIATLPLYIYYISDRNKASFINDQRVLLNAVSQAIKQNLAIHDYLEIKHQLKQMQPPETVFAIYTPEGDWLMADQSMMAEFGKPLYEQLVDGSLITSSPSYRFDVGKQYLLLTQSIELSEQELTIPHQTTMFVSLVPKSRLTSTNYDIWMPIIGLLLFTLLLILVVVVVAIRFVIEPMRLITNSLVARAKSPKETVEQPALMNRRGRSITEFMFLERSIMQLIDAYREMERRSIENAKYAAIGQTTAMVAHDIRKPYANMKAFLGLIPDKRFDEQFIHAGIRDVEDSLERADKMVADILDFSIETKLEKNECNTRSLITTALVEVIRAKSRCNIAIEYNLKHQTKLVIDKTKIIRMLTNIVDNAIDAMKGSGKLIFESSDTVDNGEMKQTIIISNNGPKIPEENIDKLFNTFFTAGKKGGSGLGLSICKKIAEAHDGSITVQSSSDKTSFIVKLPVKENFVGIETGELIFHSNEVSQMTRGSDTESAFSRNEQVQRFMDCHRARENTSYLLLVDDEPLFRESVRSLINQIPVIRDNLKVIEVGCAEQALEQMKVQKYHYVISDIDMGQDKMDGYEFIKIALHLNPNTSAIIHSNKRVYQKDTAVIDKKGFMGFVPKPMNRDDLLQFLSGKPFYPLTETEKDLLKKVTVRNKNGEASKTILIVNDDDMLRLSIAYQLKNIHHVQVLESGTIPEALELIKKSKVDIILLDINMGDSASDGYDLLRMIRGEGIEVKVYMVSGYPEREEGPKAKNLGADGYFQIPVDDQRLETIFQ